MTNPLDPRSLDLLTRTILGEAGGEDAWGQAAVAHVIRNRSLDPRWAGSVENVVLAPKQFSTWNEGPGGNNPQRFDPNSEEYKRTARVAQLVWDGQIEDKTGGATHYYSPRGMDALVAEGSQSNTIPRWLEEETNRRGGETYTHGGHIFTGRADLPALSISTKGEPEKPKERGPNPFLPVIQQATLPALSEPNMEAQPALAVYDPNSGPHAKEVAARKAQLDAENKRKAQEEAQRQQAALAAKAQGSVPISPLPGNAVLMSQGPGPTGVIDPSLYDMGALSRRFVGDSPDFVTQAQLALAGGEGAQMPEAAPRPLQGPPMAPAQSPMEMGQFKNMVNYALDGVDPANPDWYFEGGSGAGGGSGGASGGQYSTEGSLSTQGQPTEEASQSWLARHRPAWLTPDRSEILLAIGSGLLSGDDWASGGAAAGQNLLGVIQGNKQMAFEQQENQANRDGLMERAALSSASSNAPDAMAMRPFQMKDGSIAGVYQQGNRFYTADGVDVSDKVLMPMNNGDASGSKAMLTGQQVQKEQEYLINTSNTLQSMDRIMYTLQDSTYGAPAIMANVNKVIKTLINSGLTQEEIEKAVAQGKQQEILGGLRESVVGPGPMTEIDAGRLLMSMGGEIGSYFTNPEVVVANIGNLRENLKRGYDVRYNQFNAMREQFPQAGYVEVPGYTPWQPTESTGALDSSNVTQTDPDKPSDWTDEEWATLTPEEKALLK